MLLRALTAAVRWHYLKRYDTLIARVCRVQEREEEATRYRERIAAIREALQQHDDEKGRARVGADGANGRRAAIDWRNPTKAMRKVGGGG